MMPMRSLARSAPRTIGRLSSAALRQPTVARPASLLKTTWAPLRSTQSVSAFSTTALRSAGAGEVDSELSEKLGQEIEFEKQMKDEELMPASVKDFLDNSPFELIDTPGKEDVFLKRQFGNETVTVSFSISDLSNMENDMFNESDSALADDEIDPRENLRDPENLREAEADEGAMEGDELDQAAPCRLNVVVEKPGQGALNIEAIAQEGQIMVENLYYYKDAQMAHSETADATHAARDVYPGPPFASLDEDLQVLMERYLEERGVTQALAVFVPDYMDVKEQREYQTWLNNVKGFIDA